VAFEIKFQYDLRVQGQKQSDWSWDLVGGGQVEELVNRMPGVNLRLWELGLWP
jgi:hypothetical protein